VCEQTLLLFLRATFHFVRRNRLPARDVDVSDAARHILDGTLLNDFSASDTQCFAIVIPTSRRSRWEKK